MDETIVSEAVEQTEEVTEEKAGPTRNEMVIRELLTGKTFDGEKMAEAVNASNPEAKMEDREAVSIMGKLFNHTDLGFFLVRSREERKYLYTMYPIATRLAPEHARGLSLKRGQNAYTLDQVASNYPDMAGMVMAAKETKAKAEAEAERVAAEKAEKAAEENKEDGDSKGIDPFEGVESDDDEGDEDEGDEDEGDEEDDNNIADFMINHLPRLMASFGIKPTRRRDGVVVRIEHTIRVTLG